MCEISQKKPQLSNAIATPLSEILKLAGEMGFVLKSADSYRANLRSATRGVWSGVSDFFDFFIQMEAAIRRGFTQAFAEGLAEEGIGLSEMTARERQRLDSLILEETQFIEGLYDYTDANSKANGGKLGVVFSRVEQWVDAYARVRGIAKLMASQDKKMIWTLHPAEHCPSCLRLENKVKRASFWLSKGVYPKAWNKLQCRRGCKCSLEPTDQPLSRGPLPRLP